MKLNQEYLADRICVLGFILQALISWPLWLSHGRDFPMIPLADWLPGSLPAAGSILLALGILLLPLLLFWKPEVRRIRQSLLVYLLVMVILDLNRMQPWLYFYALIWFSGLFPSPNTLIRWILAGVYVWGGIQKLNPYYAEDNFAWFMEAFSWTAPLGGNPALGYLSAVFEMGIGFMLLIPRLRPFAFYPAWAMHLLIVLVLSPLGHNWNAVVLPWNLAMAALVWLASKSSTNPTWTRYSIAMLLWVWIAPILNELNWTPHAVSWNLYSNLQDERSIHIQSGLVCEPMRPIWSAYAYDRKSKLLVDDWSMHSLHVPAWNGRHTTEVLLKYLFPCVSRPDACSIIELEVNRWNKNDVQVRELPCSGQ
ncbi:MAG: hypothetical protein R2792_18535 [Saprospiraceae bacterium]